MAPSLDDGDDVMGSKHMTGDEVVISGISGVFPKSDSVLEFKENLYNKIDMVSDESKWSLNNPDIPKHVGRIRGAEKFDAQFFGVTFQLATALDPMGKKALEHAYGAIFDSGTSPQTLRGNRVGVFIGSAFADTGTMSLFDVEKRSNFVINGCSKSMLANRISYWIDGKGPSFGLDDACSSSTACLEIAYRSIKNGSCDSAIVGGCNFSLHPTLSQNLRRAGLLCLDGKTKCFDRNADGYVRADAINILFLQKAKDAHRIYAEVYHAKGNYKMRPDAQFLPLRESDDIETFLNEFYSETDLNPQKVEYVEAHGAAIAKADQNELEAISNVFAKDTSVKVGSVKSNMGNSEAASGVCAVTKLCLAYHKGELPANLHYNEPQDIPGVRDGRVQVVTEAESFDRGYTALNNFSLTGANFHVVLKGHYKEKAKEKYNCEIPHIVTASGRTESCVQKILDIMTDHPVDPEEIGLLHKVFEYDIPGHTGRGYTILDTNENNETVSIGASVEYYPGIKKPLWFVYSGMGSQWASMGADLMRIPTFAAAIHRCHKVLEPKGLDLIKVVTSPLSEFDNKLNSFIGIGAVQIGLTDVMKELGIVPDNIIGHSLGEMACAYHDDTFTAEELILCTYNRGMACKDSPLIKGSMAAVGLGYKAIEKQCPPEIDVACHNSSESTTISGPADVMTEFVAKLSKQGIFAREVPSANVAYHSRYVAPAGKELLRRLREVIKNPKLRSSKWISTSVPQNKWDETDAKYSSAEYHTNNLISPVLFEEASRMIPCNAIVVEIAPHGLLQAILKRSHKECTHIPLARRGNKDGVKFLLDAIGKLYQAGINPKVDILYPKIQFPVSTETPLLSHFVEWEHSEDWPILKYSKHEENRTASARNFVMSIHDDDHKFLDGHVRGGINVLPESAIIVLVWETVAMHIGLSYRDQSVIFRDIQFHSQVVIKPDAPLRLMVAFNRGNDSFEVSQGDTQVANGVISGVKVLKFRRTVTERQAHSDVEEITLNSEDVYRILNLRGYTYTNEFKSIYRTNLERTQAYVRWNGNWVTFIDSLIQLNNLARNYEAESTPKFIQSLRIGVQEHSISRTTDVDGVNCFNADYNHTYRVVRCAGVELGNVTFTDKPIVEQEPDVLETRAYYPYYRMDNIDLITALQINLQVINENTTMQGIHFACHPNLIEVIYNVSRNIPNLNIDITSMQNDEDLEGLIRNQKSDMTNVLLVENIFGDKKKLNSLQALSKDSFVLALEAEVPKLKCLQEQFTAITSMSDGKHVLVLLKKKNIKHAVYISISFDNTFAWVSRVYEELQKTKHVVLISQRQPYCGALGFVRKLKSDGVHKVSLVVIDDYSAPTFNPNSSIYKDQLEKNLTINILKKGEWGGYYYTPSATSTMLRDVTLTSAVPGDMGSLMWTEAAPMPASNNLVQISYAGLSLNDSKKAVGMTNTGGTDFGMDFSGIDKNGERIMGIVPGGALASKVEADPYLLWPVPTHWSLQDAATVPLPYAMAYYCLAIKGQLLKNQTVLITGGAGALGQAIITVCLSQDCTVFTTVSSQQKKDFLLRLFPQLDDSKIVYSRDEYFEHIIRSKSKDNGCDFVINCTRGQLRRAAMKCAGLNGCFFDLNDYDMNDNNHFGMTYLSNERSYISVNVSNIFRRQHLGDKKLLQMLVADGITRGIVKPISRVEYSPSGIVRAFRLLSSSKHIGRVVIKMRSPDILSQGLEVTPTMNYCSKGVYIIVCDKNGLGIELADKLVTKGARNIILHLNGKVSGYLQTKFLSWRKYNTAIKIWTDNIRTEQGCIKLLKDASTIGPIKGIFIVQNNNLSNEKDNAQEQIVKQFNEMALVVINLDLTSKHYCKDLSQFVMLTTAPRNASDAYTISTIERICQARTAIGLPALILYTDSINELTHITNKQNSNMTVQSQKLSTFFNAMEKSLKLKYSNVFTFNLNKTNDSGYLEKLSQLLGVIKIENMQNDIIIDDLKLNEVVLEELKTLIEKYHQVYYTIKKIQRMTIESLKNIRNNTRTERKAIKGLGAFYTIIDDQENQLATSHPIVPMMTLLNNGTDNNINPEGNYLTLIPGFEGRHQIFATAAERLKVQAVAVQLAPDMEGDSIPEIAATVRKFMKTKFETKSKFYLLGYSFGINVALELAALLEKEGHVGLIYCLDSSPDALKIQLKAYLDNLNESELQNAVVEHVYKLMTGHESEELQQLLIKIDNWTEKVEECLKSLRKLGNYSNQYKRAILESAYRRILLAQEYEPDFKLESEIVLLRGIPHRNAEDLAEDYNLSKYTKKQVKVFHLETDHVSVPFDFTVSNIVNKMLDPKMLEDFKKKNLCEKYIF